ncbi:MAG: hypothetical protein V8R16_02440 [Bacilli bacterium]
MKKKNSIYSLITIILLLIPIYQPKLFTQYDTLKVIYAIANVLLFIFLFIKNKMIILKKNSFNLHIFWLIYRFYLLFMMFINNNMIYFFQWANLTLMVLNLILLFEKCEKENKVKPLLMAISIIGIVMLTINFITLILFPRGIIRSDFFDLADNDWYFLGIKTQFSNIMFGTIAASGTLYILNKNKKNLFIVIATIISILLNIFYKNLATPVVGMIIIIIMIIFNKIKSLRYNIYLLFWLSIFISVLVINFGVVEIFSYFITSILHKSMSLSSRTLIWQNARDVIFNQDLFFTIFGNGEFYSFVPYDGRMLNAHNEILTIFYNSGIIGSILLLSFFLRCFKGYNQRNNKAIQFIYIICFAELIMMITEEYLATAICYVPFLLLPYISNYISNVDRNELCVFKY